MPIVSVIIVNWNSKDYVRRCLLSLARHVDIDHQVIVVDGASYDGCAEMISLEFPAVEFIQSPENIGFGRCNNLGATRATGDYLLFLNPDTEVTPGAVQALLAVAENDPRVGLVGARLLNTDGTLQTSCVQSLPSPLNQALDSEFLRHLLPKSSLWGNFAAFMSANPIQVEAVSGACMLTDHKTFTQIGGFNSAYFMYAEDMHLCWDVNRLCKEVIYSPHAEVIHHGGGASAGEFSSFSCLEMRRALHQFICSRQGMFAGLAYRLFMACSATIRLALLFAVTPSSSAHRSARIRASRSRWWTTLLWALRPQCLATNSFGKANSQPT